MPIDEPNFILALTKKVAVYSAEKDDNDQHIFLRTIDLVSPCVTCRHATAWLFAEAGCLMDESENNHGRIGRDFFILHPADKPGMHLTIIGKIRCHQIHAFVRNAAHLYRCPLHETEEEHQLRSASERQHLSTDRQYNKQRERQRKENNRRLQEHAEGARKVDESSNNPE